MKYSVVENKSKKSITEVDFGYLDARGREIGAEITTEEINFIAAPETQAWGCIIEPGHYYAVTFHATRKGAGYGPIQPDKYYKTEAERTAEIERYLAYARKKAKAEDERGGN